MDKRDNLTKTLVALSYVEEASYKAKRIAYEVLQKNNFVTSGIDLTKILGAEKADAFQSSLNRIESIFEAMEQRGVHWITYRDEEYSDTLRQTEGFPFVLFAKGNVALLNKEAIAVVGTRAPSRYGYKVADAFAREFVRAGLVIVSGLARGVDATAHKAAVQTDGETIAVYACGLDTVYPADHKGLAESIIEKNGLWVSEYALGVKPLQYHFPERNRIISGLSRATFLSEATLKSGSLITVRCALEQGRDIFVVPGSVYAAESEGSNQLLREMPHALVLEPKDVLNALGYRYAEQSQEAPELDIIENKIVEALHDNELHFEDLLAETGLTPSELTSTLINLELNGIIEQTTGNYYTLS